MKVFFEDLFLRLMSQGETLPSFGLIGDILIVALNMKYFLEFSEGLVRDI